MFEPPHPIYASGAATGREGVANFVSTRQKTRLDYRASSNVFQTSAVTSDMLFGTIRIGYMYSKANRIPVISVCLCDFSSDDIFYASVCKAHLIKTFYRIAVVCTGLNSLFHKLQMLPNVVVVFTVFIPQGPTDAESA